MPSPPYVQNEPMPPLTDEERETLALITAPGRIRELEQENDAFKETLRACNAEIAAGNETIRQLRGANDASARGIERARAEKNEKERILQTWVVAFGLLTNLKPDLDLDPHEPQRMAEAVYQHVLKERARHRQLNDPPPGILSIKIACGSVHSEHLIPAVMILSAMDPPRMVSEALSDELEAVLTEAMKTPEQLGMTRKPS